MASLCEETMSKIARFVAAFDAYTAWDSALRHRTNEGTQLYKDMLKAREDLDAVEGKSCAGCQHYLGCNEEDDWYDRLEAALGSRCDKYKPTCVTGLGSVSAGQLLWAEASEEEDDD